MIAALLLAGTLAVATPPPADAGACAPTIAAYVGRLKNVDRANIDQTSVGDYGLAGFRIKPAGILSYGWFARRAGRWCLLGFEAGVVGPQSGIRLGVPDVAAEKVFVQFMRLRKDDPD